MLTTAMRWQLLLNATPRQVFGALVATASAHGRLLSVENFGTVLVFAPSGGTTPRCAALRARVQTGGCGTLLTFEPAQLGGEVADTSVQAESVGSLIRQLRQRMVPTGA